ncbi:TonB-dependent receptor plug domain-containing protein [Bacteroides sp.]
MKKYISDKAGRYLVIVFSLQLWFVYSQMLSAQSKPDSIASYFHTLQSVPQEKLYLHLDKPYYGAGDHIWYKGYLVNAISHMNDSKSNFIIAELVNQTDSVILRKKIRRDSLGFQNAFELPGTLPAGDYYLRGYTHWMLNEDPAFFYSHNLKIGNSIDVAILSDIRYEVGDDGNGMAKIRFTGNQNSKFGNVQVKYRYFEDGKLKDWGRKKTDEYGQINISLDRITERRRRRVEIEFDDPQYSYQKTFYLPAFSKDFDVSFFPEGGPLLSVLRQNVAFKAQGADGLSREIDGYVMNAKGDTLAHIRSEHDGMGAFDLTPVPGESYYAVLTSSDHVTRRFDLPAVRTDGIVLSAVCYKQSIRFQIQKAEQTAWPDELYLLAHTRGKLVAFHPINPQKPFGKLSSSQLQEGITHLFLVDGSGRAISERLVFITDRQAPQWQVRTDKTRYGKREKVRLQITAKDFSGKPLDGSFSISITNHRNIQVDSLADNILSNLLLTSDLKGNIENPGFYFLKQDVRTEHYLDLVMLTYGWCRHRIENVLREPTVRTDYYIEAGQSLSGRVKGFFGGKVKRGAIYALAPKRGIMETTMTNEKGEFVINTSFRDSVVFAIQARTKKGFAGVDIVMDESPLPPTSNLHPYPRIPVRSMDDYLMDTREKYYMEGGMRMYNLREVVVTGNKKRESGPNVYSGITDYSLSGDRLGVAGQTVLQILDRLPGVRVHLDKNEIYVRNNPQQPVIVVDDLVYEDMGYSLLETIRTDEVETLSLVGDAAANYFGPRAAGGAIIINLKEHREMQAPPSRGIILYTPLGYSSEVEFYHPVYDTPQKKNSSKSDLRTTVYWNPELRLNAEGNATVEYFTPDSTAPEDVVIEGVDKTGKACRFVTTINQ